MPTNRKRIPRKRKPSGFSATEEHYISGARYDDPLPPECNRWEWFDLWCGGKKIDADRRKEIEMSRKANTRIPAA